MHTVVHSSYTKSSATNLQHLKTRRPSVLELQTRPCTALHSSQTCLRQWRSRTNFRARRVTLQNFRSSAKKWKVDHKNPIHSKSKQLHFTTEKNEGGLKRKKSHVNVVSNECGLKGMWSQMNRSQMKWFQIKKSEMNVVSDEWSQMNLFLNSHGTVAASQSSWRWMRDAPQTGCARRITPIYQWREQAIIQWSRCLIFIVACCHSVK